MERLGHTFGGIGLWGFFLLVVIWVNRAADLGIGAKNGPPAAFWDKIGLEQATGEWMLVAGVCFWLANRAWSLFADKASAVIRHKKES